MKAERIAFLGVEGSYSYQAAQTLFPGKQLVGRSNFKDVVTAVTDETADVAVIPLENSITGRIPDVHRLMLTMQLQIVAEYMLKIEHCFIRPAAITPGEGIRNITKLYSHQQGLLQCRTYIEREFPEAEQIATADTASAVRMISETTEDHVGAIGSSVAAAVYGAMVVDEDIADEKDNFTRFAVLQRPEEVKAVPDADMTTMIFQVQHYPGALLHALQVFEEEEINITKLETYTISQQTLLPTFYLDLGAGISSAPMRNALEKLKKKTAYIKILGSYKSSETRKMTSGFLPAKEEGRPV